MPPRVLTTPEADADLGAAFDWYESHLPGLGADFLAEVGDSCASLACASSPAPSPDGPHLLHAFNKLFEQVLAHSHPPLVVGFV